MTRLKISVQAADFDLAAEYAAIATQPGIGGIGCFIGQVRAGSDLISLTLEHYPGMTEKALHAIAHQASQRWPLHAITIIHRIGTLTIGQPIVLVLAAAAHRHAALSATQFLIDWLKTDAPFWKQERFSDGGSHWVEARQSDQQARQAWDIPLG